MGMFDTVIIESLKLKTPPEVKRYLKENNATYPNDFQSKDLVNSLSVYKVKENGQLYREERKPTGKKIPYDVPFFNFRDNRSFLERLYFNKKYKTNEPEPKLVDELKSVFVKDKLTATIEIYNTAEINKRYVSLDYSLKFVDGVLKSHSLNNWEIEDEEKANVRHKENDAFKIKMDENFARRKEFTSNWYYPVLKEIYNPIVFFGKMAVQHICNKIITWSYRWNGI